ncbi:ankyrin repeat-containing domain protein [Aspergillus sergii]|uniref:Ankyrin repeat-containing domain protein n=1 Tax=Aspergillus sergii TaxID=1034303 RepID=A0A5N6X5Y8_9EURO|nr:ankyrin repeat-containing domain protein [Aspergillus sergii]
MARRDALPPKEYYDMILQKIPSGKFNYKQENVPEENMAWAVKQGRLDILQIYLKAGVDPNSYTLSGKPMLSHAACEGQIESARILLHYGADPCLPSLCGGQTPLMYAVYRTAAKFRSTGEAEMINLMLRAGAKITSLKLFRCICCVLVKPEPLVQLAILNGTEFLALKDNWGETVLHKAVRYSEGLTALILKAAPELLHERTSDGRTALHVAVDRGCVAAARYLVALNEITDAVDVNGETALHIAVKRDLKRVQLLTGHQDVDINGLNASNETPLCIAISYHTISHCYLDTVDHLLRDPRIYIDPMSVLAMKRLFRPTELWLLLLSEDVLLLIRFLWLYTKQEGYISHLKGYQESLFALLPYLFLLAHLPLIVWVLNIGSDCALV